MEEITEDPHFQYFIGLSDYQTEVPFVLVPQTSTNAEENRGTQILDATCVPQNISFAQDILQKCQKSVLMQND